jgi:hypothetical protein
MEPVALTAIVSFMALATGFWHAVAAVILTPLAAWATTFILPRFTTPTDNTGRIALAIIAPFIATLPASLLSGHMTLMIGTVPLLTIAHSLLSRMTSESLFAERALMRSCAQLSWAISRTSLVEWFQRSEVSRGMHGPIQTAIANTIPRLADAVERNEQTFGLVGELQRRIVHALGSLVNPRAESMNLEQELFDIVETWAGVATIQVDVAPDFLLPLSSDPACATAVVDTVAEACATAVRQHNATEIVVTVAPAPNAVLVNVTDNGRIGIANVDTDLTLHLLEYCSLRWYRRHLATTNVIAAVLPYRPEHAITSPRAALTRIQRPELSQ